MFGMTPSTSTIFDGIVKHCIQLAGTSGLSHSTDAADLSGAEGMFAIFGDLSEEDLGKGEEWDDTPAVDKFLRLLMGANKRRKPRSEARTRRLVFFDDNELNVCIFAVVSFSPIHPEHATDLSKVGHWALSFRARSVVDTSWSIAQTFQGELTDNEGLEDALDAFAECCEVFQKAYTLKPVRPEGPGYVDLSQFGLGVGGPAPGPLAAVPVVGRALAGDAGDGDGGDGG